MDIWNKCIKVGNKSLKSKDIPVGALIVKNGQIISVGYNTREKNNDVLGHAEINAIKKATKKIKNWNLQGYDLYVTLKPCHMCTEIINQARISNIYYLLDKSENKKEYNKTNFIKINNNFYEKTYNAILHDFFINLRENKR